MRSTLAILFIGFFFNIQAQETAKTTFERKGFVFGAAIGGSTIRLQNPGFSEARQAGLSFPNFKIGVMLTPRSALLLCLPGTVYSYDLEGRTRDRGFEGMIPSFQYWASNRFWVLGGAGLGLDAPAFYDIKDATERKFYFGAAAIAGAGYELWRTKKTAFDVQARVHYGKVQLPEAKRSGLAFSLLLGFNFY